MPRLTGGTTADVILRVPGLADLDAIVAYDAKHFGCPRAGFIGEWTVPADKTTRRSSLIAERYGEISGMGTIRDCREGYKIGPLFAEDPATAETLFAALCRLAPGNAAIALDTPEGNADAVALATRAGLTPVFETARMYRGEDPGLPLDRIFGVTTFELG